MPPFVLAELVLEIESVVDMDLERAAAVGRAFDADPELRPRRVGGDPARIRVESSLEDLIRRTGLPIDWLTVRTQSRTEFEGGTIELRPGRGGYVGWPQTDGEWTYVLVPHKVEVDFLRSWATGEPDRLDRIAALFTRLCEALDACYGIATTLPRAEPIPPVDVGIGDVGWLNFFGPAFLERWPSLADTGLPTTRLSNGGVAIRASETPWQIAETDKQPVLSALPDSAFVRSREQRDRYEKRGILVPSYLDHMRFSPGTEEMPWEIHLREKASARAERSRSRRYVRARSRREELLAGREPPPSLARNAEWSTSLDSEDWRSFARLLFRRLGGELSGPLARVLIDETTAAPVGTEDWVVINSVAGQIELRWFIDDVDTIDVYLFGPEGLPSLIDAEYERWANR